MDVLKNITKFLNEPIPSFFFEVLFLERFDLSNPLAMVSATASLAVQALDPVATAFSEIDGLEIALNTEDHQEGGWSVPRPMFTNVTASSITLKRYLRPRHIGVMGFSLDPVSGWCQDTVRSTKIWHQKIITKDILIFIYHPMIQNPLPVGPSSFPIAGFMAQEAFPVKWGISSLSSTNDGEPIVETIEFKYTELQRLAIPPA